MVDLLLFLLFLGVLALAAVGGFLLLKGGGVPKVALFGPRPERRLAVVEHASVDGRRRLVLVRRDDVEHLIMTGGPVDVVIETGIGERKAPATAPRFDAADGSKGVPVFGRQSRTNGRPAQQMQQEPSSDG